MAKITKKNLALWLTCCGACCVSRPTDHYDGTGAIPRAGVARSDAQHQAAAAAAEMVVAAFSLHVHLQCCTLLNVRTTLPTVSWDPDLAGPCLRGSPAVPDCFLISRHVKEAAGYGFCTECSGGRKRPPKKTENCFSASFFLAFLSIFRIFTTFWNYYHF